MPRAVLVDPPALQRPPRAAAGSVCRADFVKVRSACDFPQGTFARPIRESALLADLGVPRLPLRRIEAAAVVAAQSREGVRAPTAACQEAPRANRQAQHRAVLPQLEHG